MSDDGGYETVVRAMARAFDCTESEARAVLDEDVRFARDVERRHEQLTARFRALQRELTPTPTAREDHGEHDGDGDEADDQDEDGGHGVEPTTRAD